MKVIDAMQKVANGEIFKFNIKGIDDCTYFVNENHCICDNTDGDLAEWLIDDEWLNREVEIIEDNKIKKWEYKLLLDADDNFKSLKNKLDEIIEIINKELK